MWPGEPTPCGAIWGHGDQEVVRRRRGGVFASRCWNLGVRVCEWVERTLKVFGKTGYTGNGGAEDGRAWMERVSRSGQRS